MSHLTTLVERYLKYPDRRNHFVANIIEYMWSSRDQITEKEVLSLVDKLEKRL